MHVQLRVNDHDQQLDVAAEELLIDALRDRLGLTGAKHACSMGNCGTCTVRLDGETVYACLVLAAECDGRGVDTVEGLAVDDQLDPVQAAFVETDALQCGFCTPGQVLAVCAVLDAHPVPTDDDLVRGLAGNLCRCGAYAHILEAARRAADARADGHDGRS